MRETHLERKIHHSRTESWKDVIWVGNREVL